ncbi:EscR/YscR/HrcR family type III secretion system export apparatus protein [Sphingomonas sp. So64.6b]|uniref:type III secretion system export apparatus subunit SctR n=1 Tax=Sphingomonas sp. So64.6b TaxID=2997354 RepID=UPI0016025CA4|nr:type III secretion system export apparatus subunit SctR [Sphingomonas sp. So64.6b]QNA86379.1 EscR/YscR/HrcR family type III secretion system export apparatus protein [Sphingomonas sp. So64.6b]
MDLSTFTPGSALVVVVALAIAPFFAVMVTSFTKIVVTLSLLRNALGLQQVPPNIVLNGLSLILTLYVMYPVGQQMQEAIRANPQQQQMQVAEGGPNGGMLSSTNTMLNAVEAGKEPLRAFLIKHSDPRERSFFLKTAQRVGDPKHAVEMTDRDFIVAIPAFVVKELSLAFQIGFLIFLPFLVIDLVISNILLAMGMMMLSPTTISLPFKLLLFVLVDGWVKLAHGLVLSYV